MSQLDQNTARRLIGHLKAGTTPIDCVEYINVGNERWYSAAETQFDEIQADADSLVRFINGYYGDGKTHFMGMLRSIALNKCWLVSYVSAENTPLHKYETVYSELVKNITLPTKLLIPDWLAGADVKGANALLAAVFAKFYIESNRLSEKGGLQKERVLEALRLKGVELASNPDVHQSIGRAVIAYIEAVIGSDALKYSCGMFLDGGCCRAIR